MMEFLQTVITVVLFFAILGGLVLVHELGHFVTARMANIRVLEFGIGFPPRAKVLRSGGETLYTLNWLPIGGFVKLEGEDGDDTSDPRSFVNARLPVKLVILIAGVFMNLVTAFLIFLLIAWIATPLVGVRIGEVQPDSPAAAAGLQAGEAILAVDGQTFDFYGEGDVISAVRAKAGQTVVLTVERLDGSRADMPANLRPPEELNAERGALGIGAGPDGWESRFFGPSQVRDLPSAVGLAARDTGRWFGLILAGLGDLVGSVASDPGAAPPVAGPIGIAQSLGEIFWGSGPIMTLYVAGILSANLALVNALPFPPLDGGRILMILLKKVFGTRISVRAERLTYFVGFIVLFTFLIWITGFDIQRGLEGTR